MVAVMAMEPALALVVRGTDWSETSRIATLWTREFGKVRALAKGGRRLRSSFEIAFDLLTVCHVVVIRKHSGSLDLLTEAQVAERFPHLRTDLAALYAGYYVAELLADGTQEYDPHPGLFDAALATLRTLADPAVDRPALVSGFELVWLKELGYGPRLDTCAGCAADLSPTDRVGYSPTAGGVVCPACRPAVRDHRPLTAPAWAALRGLARGEPAVPAGVRREVRALLGETVTAVLGKRPKLLGYVDGGTGS
jgi:DNA repair protein RecO (recombination protein O)